METFVKHITPQDLEKAFSYAQYRQLLNQLFAEGKTTGTNQSESLLEYATLNLQRMSRVEKTTILNENIKNALSNLNQKLIWVVLSEGWCGDAAQSLPAIQKIAEASDKIELKILLRDENLAIMDAYLTNGGRSIPKLICLNENLEEIGTWGPRPQKAQDIFLELKAAGKDYATELHKWYAKDRSESLQAEFVELLKNWTL